jgi:hypothetical protein
MNTKQHGCMVREPVACMKVGTVCQVVGLTVPGNTYFDQQLSEGMQYCKPLHPVYRLLTDGHDWNYSCSGMSAVVTVMLTHATPQ